MTLKQIPCICKRLLTFDVLHGNIWMLNTEDLRCWCHWFEVLWFWPHWRWRCTHEGSAAREGYRSHPEYSPWATHLWTSEGNRYPSPAPDPHTLTHTGIHVDISKQTAVYLWNNYAKRTMFDFTRKHVQSHAAHCDHVWLCLEWLGNQNKCYYSKWDATCPLLDRQCIVHFLLDVNILNTSIK